MKINFKTTKEQLYKALMELDLAEKNGFTISEAVFSLSKIDGTSDFSGVLQKGSDGEQVYEFGIGDIYQTQEFESVISNFKEND